MTNLFKFLIIPIFSCLFCTNIFAQTESIFNVMNHSEVLEIMIEADIDSLKNSRRTNATQKAYLTFPDKNNELQKWKIKVRTRGKSRRQICEMPPLRLSFKKAKLDKEGLSKFNDMKLVTHCLANRKEAKRLLMKEYLTYQLYNELTESSFHTQLVSVTYLDKNTGEKEENWGFLIEDVAELATRLNAKRIHMFSNKPQDFEEGTPEVIALFQYMIGNKDYQVEAMRNVKILERNNMLIPIAYDFDYSGLVNASYAKPDVNYNLSRVTDRAYLGSAESLAQLKETKKIFLEKKDSFLEIVNNFEHLDKKSKQQVIKYLNQFYKNIDKIKLAERAI